MARIGRVNADSPDEIDLGPNFRVNCSHLMIARSSQPEQAAVMKVRALIEMLETDGWRLVRTRGSHRQFRHSTKRGTITVSGKHSADVPRGTLNVILKRAKLEG